MPPGRIRQSDIENVRDRTDIVRLIGEYVPLKKAGRQFRGPCPFHKEKDPSFYVDPAKGVFHCFGCKAGGNAFDFVMKIESLTFAEGVERLADRLGYQLSYDEATEAEVKGRLEKERLFKLNRTAAEYYRYVLTEAGGGKAAREYLAARGLADAVVEEFKLGYAPAGWENLCGFLSKKGFAPAEIVTVGLARERKGRGGQGTYDVFRDRLMFPIQDHRGRVVAFGGRALPGGASAGEPKYINSPETPIYRKGHVLYGYSQARAGIQDTREAIVVEGYTDLLALRQAGFGQVVATLGTALTENHFDLLARVCDTVHLAFDSDRAGLEAAGRALQFWNRFRLDVFVVRLPAGEDPASFVEKEGADEFARLKDGAVDLLEFSVRRAVESCDTSTAAGRRRAMAACVPVLSRVSSEEFMPLRNELVRTVAGLLDMPEETMEVYVRRALKSSRRPGTAAERERPAAMWEKVEREAIQVLLHRADALVEQLYLDEDYFTDPGYKKIFGALKEFQVRDEENLQAGFESFVKCMLDRLEDHDLRGRVSSLLVEPPPECDPGHESKVFETLKLNFFKREKRRAEFEISKVNPRVEPKKYEALFARLLEIQQIIREQFPYDHN